MSFTCEICKTNVLDKDLHDHYTACLLEKHKENSGYLVRFVATGEFTDEIYFLYALVGLSSKLSHIEMFLKRIWLECCGHLSQFTNISDDNKELSMTSSISKYFKNTPGQKTA